MGIKSKAKKLILHLNNFTWIRREIASGLKVVIYLVFVY